MKKTTWIPLLTGTLVAQLGLTLLLQSAERDRGQFVSSEPLVRFTPAQVDRIRIESESGSAEIVKGDDGWTLPEYFDFPASGSRIEKLLERIATLEPGWPVGRSDDAARRFEVSEKKFERKLSLGAKDTELATLYFGTSPGARKVHAREASRPEIYAVDFGVFEIPGAASEWIDRTLLQRELSEIERIEVGDLKLVRRADPDSEEARFELEGLGEGETTDIDATRSLVGRVAKLRIQSILGTEAKPEYGQESPLAQVKVYPVEGDVVTYTISKPKEGSSLVLKVSGRPFFFEVSADSLRPITELERTSLLERDAEDDAAAQAGAGDTDAATSGAANTPTEPSE